MHSQICYKFTANLLQVCYSYKFAYFMILLGNRRSSGALPMVLCTELKGINFASYETEHPWLKNADKAPNVSLGELVRSRLKQFSSMNKFKKKALGVSCTEPGHIVLDFSSSVVCSLM